jgi:DNA-binding LacI/PurR family transcriptional regulator
VPRKGTRKTVAKAADIRTVAALAKVSIATVSRTINGSPAVSDRLSKRVWQAIEQLNYFPNTHARSLVSGRSRLFGIIVENITNPFFPELIHSFEQFAVEARFEILLGSTNYNPALMASVVRRMIERRVEGVAVMTSEMESSLLEQLTDRRVPLVFMDVAPAALRVSNVCVDYAAGVTQAVQHLQQLGHERLAFIGGPLQLKSARQRRDAFLQCLAEASHRAVLPLILDGDHKLEGGELAVQKLLSAVPRPTAVLCSNDLTAIGVLRGLDAEGLRAPRDMSVVGFDDIHMARFTLPPLTTVRLSRAALARLAFDALICGLENPQASQGASYRLETNLVVRGSTARLGAAVPVRS